MTKTNPVRGALLHSIFTVPFGPRPVFDKPNEGGAEPPATPLATPPAPEPKKDPATPPQPEPPKVSDNEAKLLKEAMKAKKDLEDARTALKAFEGLDPEAVKKLVADAAAAEEKRKKDEEAAALARGEFDRVKANMVTEHQRALKAEQDAKSEVEKALAAAQATINDLTVGQGFASSKFLTEQTVLPTSKARLAYGAYFEVVDGKPVAYDKPRGASERTPLNDASGNALPFEAAIQKIVEMDPDRDSILRSKMIPGAGSKPGAGVTPPATPTAQRAGLGRIEAALAAQRKAGTL